jgi:hypothetical protein
MADSLRPTRPKPPTFAGKAAESFACLARSWRRDHFAFRPPSHLSLIMANLHARICGSVNHSKSRVPCRHPPIQAEIRIGHRVERKCCFNTPTRFPAEFVSKLTIIEQSEHTIG